MIRSATFPSVALTVAALTAFASPALAISVNAQYAVTMAGISVGRASLAGTFEGDRYDLKVNGGLTGIAGAFSGGTKGGAAAAGSVAGPRPVSTSFSAFGGTSEKTRTVRFPMSSGNVGKVEIDPPFESRPDRVPLTEAHLRSVVDPLGGLVVVAANRAKLDEPANCNRTVPVFDGTMRFNVVMSYQGTRTVNVPGYSGNVLVCGVRYVPVAGHRPERPAVKFMTENRDMSVSLAPVEGTRVLLPFRAAFATFYGTVVIEAEKWRVDGREAAAATR